MSEWDQDEEVLDRIGAISQYNSHVIDVNGMANRLDTVYINYIILIGSISIDREENSLHSKVEDHETHQNAVVLWVVLSHCLLVEIVHDYDDLDVDNSCECLDTLSGESNTFFKT